MADVSARKKRPAKAVPSPDLSVSQMLEHISAGKQILHFKKSEIVFAQGDAGDAIFFIETGKIKISVVSTQGKEAVLSMLGPHNFLGEGCLVGQSHRMSTASALEASTLFRVERGAMLNALREQTALSQKFIAGLLVRNIEVEEDFCDQLFNHSEKRLARVLLKLARLRERGAMPDARIPIMSHEILAEMVGTTRSRTTHFLNKFRKLGLIDYDGETFTVKTELLTDLVLHD